MIPQDDEPAGNRIEGHEHRARFLALGDSYTIGEAVPEQDRWPSQLVSLLRAERIAIGRPTIIAETGWTTGELLAGIDRSRPAGVYDLVSLLIGVNNQYRGLDISNYRRELDELLSLAIEFTGGSTSHVLVLSIPDWSVTPFAKDRDRDSVARDIDRFNTIKHRGVSEFGCRYVNVTSISRQTGHDESFLASDGLHPSGQMYAEWAKLALPVARQSLNEP